VVERCEECGYAYDLAAATQAGHEIEVLVAELAELLTTTSPRTLAQRTQQQLWSPLEYACHVRDVLLTQRERVLLARRADIPPAVPMGREERVAHEGYAEQDPIDCCPTFFAGSTPPTGNCGLSITGRNALSGRCAGWPPTLCMTCAIICWT